MLKEGYCKFCNQPRLVDVPEENAQEETNEAVTKNVVVSWLQRYVNVKNRKKPV